MSKIRTISANTSALLDLREENNVLYGRVVDVMAKIYGNTTDDVLNERFTPAWIAFCDALDELLLLSIQNETASLNSTTI